MKIMCQTEVITHGSNLFWHTPAPIPKTMKTPAAKAVLDKEWDKLKNVPPWDESMSKVNRRYSQERNQRV